MRKTVSIITAACLVGFALTSVAAGEIYRWKDASGVFHYSDQPQPGAELISGPPKPPAPSTPTPSPTPARAADASASNGGLPPVSKEVAAQVRQEVTSVKADQCKKAEDVYQKSIQARRMYKEGEKGERTFLSDAELDATRLQARSSRDLACAK
jgi:Domain of unknown function (DUF4124)